MFDVIPEILRKSRRGMCPTCGAPLKLVEAGRNTRCDFCGGDCKLEHRLRTLEPEVGLDPVQHTDRVKGATRWLSLKGKREQCECPGCGNSFEPVADHSHQKCPYCGSESKLEARLTVLTPDNVQAPQQRTEADRLNQQRNLVDYPLDVWTEQLCWRVLNEPDLMRRINLAGNFSNWGTINPTTAHFLPHLLEHAQHDHDAVALELCDAVGKLLCSDDANYAVPVLQACAGQVFNVHGKRRILSELALGRGVCVKLLLDAAEVAAAQGARDYACHACWGVNTIFGRNFDQHETMAEIVLYRMFYLTGTVLGWAVYIFKGGFHCGYRLPWKKLVLAMDDFAHERPELLGELRQCFYLGPAANSGEYADRLAVLRGLSHPHARAAAGRILGAPPGNDETLGLAAVELFHPLLADEATRTWAIMALRAVISGCEMGRVPNSIRNWVKQNLENLPAEIKRELRWRESDKGILPEKEVYYWTSDPKDEPTPELQALLADWDAGIRAAVDAERGGTDEMRKLVASAEKLEVPVMLAEGPATIPLRDPPKPEPKPKVVARPKPELRPAPGDETAPPAAEPVPAKGKLSTEQMMAEITRLQSEFADSIQKMSTDLQKPGVSERDYAAYSAKMMAMGVELQRQIETLTSRHDPSA